MAASFERELKQRVRETVRASPKLWSEYVARRGLWWWTRLLSILLVPALPFGAVFMPACFSILFIGMARVFGEGPYAGRGNGPATALGLSAILYSGLPLLVAWSPKSKIRSSDGFAIAVYFAKSDRQLLREACHEGAGAGIFAAYLRSGYSVILPGRASNPSLDGSSPSHCFRCTCQSVGRSCASLTRRGSSTAFVLETNSSKCSWAH
jgi:hypothetical protein